MKTLIQITFIATLLQFVMVGRAASQDVRQATIVWQATNVRNPASGLGRANDSRFVSNAVEFRWTQKGSKTYLFTVEEMIGTWADLKLDGQIEFRLKMDGRVGSAIISRSGGKYVVRLRYQRQSGEVELNLEFEIDHVEAQ
jgi:hypothetical protein